MAQAIFGGTIRIQGIYEDQTVMIIPGTSSHTSICLTGKGLKKVNSLGYGDHYVNIKIAAPTKLNDKQRELLHAYAEMEDDTPGIIHGIPLKGSSSRMAASEAQSEERDNMANSKFGIFNKIKQTISGYVTKFLS